VCCAGQYGALSGDYQCSPSQLLPLLLLLLVMRGRRRDAQSHS